MPCARHNGNREEISAIALQQLDGTTGAYLPRHEREDGWYRLPQALLRLAITASHSLGFQTVTVKLRRSDGSFVTVADTADGRLLGSVNIPDFWEAALLPQYQVSNSYLIPPEHTRRLMELFPGDWRVPDLAPAVEADDWDPLHMLIVPFLDSKGEVLGLFSVDRPASGKLPGMRLVRDLETFAHQAALTVEHSQFGQDLQALYSDTVAYAERLKVIQAIATRLNRMNDIRSVGQTLAEELHDLINYHACRVYLLSGATLVPIALYGAHEEYSSESLENMSLQLGVGVTGWAALHGQDLLIEDLASDPRSSLIPGTDEIDESMLVTPMRYGDRVIGVITLSKLGLSQFGQVDLQVLSTLAAQAATAIENARLFERLGAEAQTLRQSEERFRSLIQNASDIVTVLDSELRMRYSSPAIVRVLGYSAEDDMGTVGMARVHPDDVPALQEVIRRSQRHPHAPYTVEAHIQHANGSWRLMELTFNNLLEDEAVRGIVINSRDITERKRAETALLRRDAILQAVSFAAQRFLESVTDWEQSVQEVLSRLGEATSVSRVYIFENHLGPCGQRLISQKYEWTAPGVISHLDDPALQSFDFRRNGFERWEELLDRGEIIHGPIRLLPEAERAFMQTQDLLAIVVVPIFVGNEWWGLIGFDDCLEEREWTPAELDSLRAAASTLGAAHQRKRTEEALRESEERYATVSRATNDVIWEWRPEVETLTWSCADEQVFGYALSQVAGGSWWEDRVHPDDRERVVSAITGVYEGRSEFWSDEYRFRQADGTFATVIDRCYVVRDSQGRPARVIGSMMDITERKRAEAALQQSEAKLADAQRMAHLGSWEWNVVSDELWWSDEVFRIYGFQPGSLRPTIELFLSLVHHDDLERVRRAVWEALYEDKPYSFDHRIVRPNGEVRYVHRQGRVARDSTGRAVQMVGTIHDITERKELEAQLEHQAFHDSLTGLPNRALFM
ncbi:MAG: PAS domain-containing protein, partial [Chloroflexota bacterium]|nr:PAS domain-containing protein [Chloroflexota bacterium]